MTLHEIYLQFINGLENTGWLEFTAVIFGIASVLFSRKENILVYPTGIINTAIYTWLCFQASWGLYAEGSLNFYYTAMSLYGWWAWSRKQQGDTLHITKNNRSDWTISLTFFAVSWIVLFLVLKNYTKSSVPMADSFASAAAYTGMWQMTKKKIENWMWWTLTNIASIPLYFYKHAVFTSFQYLVFLTLGIMGWIEWTRKYKKEHA